MGDAPQACQDQCELCANAGNERTLMARARVESSAAEAPGCKRSASIALPQGCHRVPPKRTPAAENWLRTCI
jgi:hypothetical protein